MNSIGFLFGGWHTSITRKQNGDVRAGYAFKPLFAICCRVIPNLYINVGQSGIKMKKMNARGGSSKFLIFAYMITMEDQTHQKNRKIFVSLLLRKPQLLYHGTWGGPSLLKQVCARG